MPRPPKRQDPVSRPVDGAGPDSHWANLSPDRHYVEVPAKADYHGVDYYLALGYEVETHRPGGDGPKPRGTYRAGDGSELTRRGCILMSCPREEYNARERDRQTEIDLQERAMNANPLRAAGSVDTRYSDVNLQYGQRPETL